MKMKELPTKSLSTQKDLKIVMPSKMQKNTTKVKVGKLTISNEQINVWYDEPDLTEDNDREKVLINNVIGFVRKFFSFIIKRIFSEMMAN